MTSHDQAPGDRGVALEGVPGGSWPVADRLLLAVRSRKPDAPDGPLLRPVAGTRKWLHPRATPCALHPNPEQARRVLRAADRRLAVLGHGRL